MIWLLICIPPIISQRPKVWPNHTKEAVIMVIYISGGLVALLLCGLICYVITRVKGWASSVCWAHALGGFLLGPFWLLVCISKPRYTPGCEKVCRMGAPAFGVWLAIGTALALSVTFYCLFSHLRAGNMVRWEFSLCLLGFWPCLS